MTKTQATSKKLENLLQKMDGGKPVIWQSFRTASQKFLAALRI